MMPRVCIVGETTGGLDEGTRIIFHEVARHMASTALSVQPFKMLEDFRSARDFQPEVIIYLTGPSHRSLVLLDLLRRAMGHPPRVILGAHPSVSWGTPLAQALQPELFLALSAGSLKAATEKGILAHTFFLGVDRNRFHPRDERFRTELRSHLGLPQDGHLVLHVGHWKHNRNLGLLAKIAGHGHTVVFVASPRFRPEMAIRNLLQRAGVRVILRRVDKIEEYYQASDVYLMPTLNEAGTIEQPLSILEALATGLPVISFPIGGVTDLMKRYGGIHLVHDDRELPGLLMKSSRKELGGATASPPDWTRVASVLLAEAKTVVEG